MTKLINFVFRFSLAVISMFCVMATGRATALEVYNFEGLQGAIVGKQQEIVIKNTIDFTADGPVINYDNIVISGLGENAPGLLNGKDKYKFFIFGEDAKSISLKNLHLSNGNNKDTSNALNGGGAIHLDAGVVVNLEGLTFSNNQTKSRGGAIYSWGTDNNNRNSLNFTGKTTFDRNKTIEADNRGGAIFAFYSTLTFGEGPATFKNNSSADEGGAIFVQKSSLTFGGPATFKGNSSKSGGGAIYGGDVTELTFGGDVTFTENSSVNYGGAIFFWGKSAIDKNILKFEGNATFVRNSATGNVRGKGGAISIWNSSITFGGPATFENNSSRDNGGAIYAYYSASIEFNNGLRLIENTTGNTNSGALHMQGNLNDKLAIITIIQKNPLVPTEFRGNTSGGDGGHNAVYMTQYSRLNFFVEKGSVNIFDVFSGKKDGPDNIITINEGNGWINIEKGGSLENVKVANGGNLKLAGESDGFNLIDFTNSGTIRFEILSEKRSAKIRANSITLNAGTVLEIVAIKGQLYRAGESHDILAIEGEGNNNTIVGQENIKLKVLQKNLKIKEELVENEKIYRITVLEKVKIRTNPGEINLFSHLGTLEYNQRYVANLLSNIYFDNFADESINNMLDRIENFKNQEDQKTVLSQISPSLLTDIITMNLLSSQRNVVNRPVSSLNTLAVEPIYSNSKLASGLADNAAAIRVNYGHSFRNLMFGRDLSLAFFGDLASHSSEDSQNSKASALGLAMALRLETEVINGINIALNLSYRRNSHKIDRSIEKLNEIAKSNFSTNTFNAAMALEKEFRAGKYLIFTPSASLETSLLSYGKFSEEGAGVLNLTIDSGSHHLVAGNLNLTMAVDLANFRPFISLGASYLLSYSNPEISASFREYSSSGKLKSRATDVGKLSGYAALGLSYQLNKNMSVSLGGNYRGASGYRSFSVGAVMGYSF